MMYFLAAGGLILLLIGGDILVRGAVGVAEIWRVPPLIIGLTIVAFGTSSPELMISVEAALSGVPTMAIGNVVGSNIANVFLVLGVPALIYPIVCENKDARRDTGFMMVVSVGFVFLCWQGALTWLQGGIMLVALGGYLFWSYRVTVSQKNGSVPPADGEYLEEVGEHPRSVWMALFLVVLGLLGLAAGSRMMITGATDIALSIGVSEAVIGLTLVALGTSLPELATSMVAAYRRHGEMALGNVVGSNLFNILAVMGVTAMVKPVPVPSQFFVFDFWLMLLAAGVITLFAFRVQPISRKWGLVFSLCYVGYVLALFSGLAGEQPPMASLQ